MNWIELKKADQIETIKEESRESPVLIFKHSTRCNISRTTLNRLERHWNDQEMAEIKPYFLDLITYREVSNLLAHRFNVEHESPQIILIINEKPILALSHFEIEYKQIRDALKN